MKTIARLVLMILMMAATRASARDNVTFGGQVRPRFEFREPVNGNSDTFTSMRMRAGVTAMLEREVRAFIQIQDVRLFGDEKNTLGDFSADNFDLHQGYIDLAHIGKSPFSLRVGRQEINLGGQRLIGAVGWTQQGRSFDGVRAFVASEWGRIDVLGLRLAETTGGANASNAALVGVYGTLTSFKGASLDFYTIYNQADSPINTDQVTLGARYAARRPRVEYRLETSVQVGDRGGQDVSAFMFGGRIGAKFGKKGKVTAWYDYLSGDGDPADGETHVFDTLFPTNHKYYGFADLFLNIPKDTKNLGLQDIALKTSATPHKTVAAGLDIHSFLLAKKGGRSSRHLGEEVDLTLTYRYAKGVALVGGFSHIFADDAFGTVRGLNEDSSWGYIMTNVTF